MDRMLALFEQRKTLDHQIDDGMKNLCGREKREIYPRIQQEYKYFTTDVYKTLQVQWRLQDLLSRFDSHPVIRVWLENITIHCPWKQCDYLIDPGTLVILGPIRWYRWHVNHDLGDSVNIRVNGRDFSRMDLGQRMESTVKQLHDELGRLVDGVTFKDFHQILCSLAHGYHEWHPSRQIRLEIERSVEMTVDDDDATDPASRLEGSRIETGCISATKIGLSGEPWFRQKHIPLLLNCPVSYVPKTIRKEIVSKLMCQRYEQTNVKATIELDSLIEIFSRPPSKLKNIPTETKQTALKYITVEEGTEEDLIESQL